MVPDREIYTPKLGPPEPLPGLEKLFDTIGEEGIRDLVSRFYDRIPNSKIANMFPGDLALSKQKQADFIIQVTGGPSYYLNNWGPARMRMRHFPFKIDESARLEWLRCYMEALEESNFPKDTKEIFEKFLNGFSQWMVNHRDSSTD